MTIVITARRTTVLTVCRSNLKERSCLSIIVLLYQSQPSLNQSQEPLIKK